MGSIKDRNGMDLTEAEDIKPKYYILDSFVDYEDYSISCKGLLPTVVDIMVN